MQIAIPARAENIAIVRHALGALEDGYALDPQTLSDIRLAVTEACTNVVVHAYPDGEEGPMEVLTTLLGEELLVVVRDEGAGIGPRPDSPGLGLGLPLIASLSESVQLGRDERDRTEVRMTFSLADTAAEAQAPAQVDPGAGANARAQGDADADADDRHDGAPARAVLGAADSGGTS
ncbi:MAG TPA: ATP-binding protein [Solirubrobacteraceae bacterium]|nr:ATP-binding protein [Solirubrobacteraceae bacterium]